MTLQEIPIGVVSRENVSPSSRPSGWFCVRRGLGTLKRSPCWRTIAASPRTRHAFRIRIAWPTPRTSSPRPTSATKPCSSITLRNGTLIGACGFTAGRPPSAGVRLLARRQTLGQGLRHRGRARADRPRLHRPRLRRDAGGARASPIRRRAACWRNAASSGPARPVSHPRDLELLAPIDRFRLDRGFWASLKSWGRAKKVM